MVCEYGAKSSKLYTTMSLFVSGSRVPLFSSHGKIPFLFVWVWFYFLYLAWGHFQIMVFSFCIYRVNKSKVNKEVVSNSPEPRNKYIQQYKSRKKIKAVSKLDLSNSPNILNKPEIVQPTWKYNGFTVFLQWLRW